MALGGKRELFIQSFTEASVESGPTDRKLDQCPVILLDFY